MIIGRVVGNVWATRKEEVLVGIKFLVVQPHGPDGQGRGEPVVAADRVGGRVGRHGDRDSGKLRPACVRGTVAH
ncbi:protein of unknown function [Kyrpidia spormannii]|uniref:Ethanolamine utilization protein EutN n=1 Tax=Kyrpidia spormannii TaxID=2055160 RepID=A0A6F9EEK7_9BACL|nr:protein of unknown function [Kyrpidia spormannii]